MRHCLVAFLFIVAFLGSASPGGCGTFIVSSDADQIRLILELRAQQFLNRATFGATDAEITALADQMAARGIEAACSKWIDDQFALPPTLHLPTMKAWMAADGITAYNDTTKNLLRYRYHAWWHNAISAPDQLKQRLAWALIQINVVGESGDNFNFVEFPTIPAVPPSTSNPSGTPAIPLPDKAYWFGMSSYYDMLLNRCDDRYRDVLQDVTYHPVMGVWLSSIRNPKANPTAGTFPDENFAREIMQLFAIGLNELNTNGTFKLDAEEHVIPTYDNDDIREFARAFTGFNYASGNGTNLFNGYINYVDPMIMTNSAHDSGPKNLLNGGSIPGNVNGNIDVTGALDNLYAHPNVAPFISKLLIQRLVRSNPTKGYLDRVSKVFNNNGSGVKGDMRAVVKAILTDNEAWTSIRMTRLRNPTRLVVTGSGTEFGRMVEPVVQYASFFRRYGVAPATTNNKFYLSANPGAGNQAPFRSPSVFNFYLPHHQPSGGLATALVSRNIPNGDLAAPEFQILTSVSSNTWYNRSRSDIINEFIDQFLFTNTNARFSFDFTKEKNVAASQAGLVEYLDRVLCNGTMSDDFRTRLSDAIATKVTLSSPPSASQLRDRVRGAMITVMNSPFYLIRY